ncbi:pseudouridine synthase [Actomonas aquatica]|uniref:Pseudouridine synthase n=1 Tax=Actomonas aquatica TaxID=2866162 RepID=A0ABZ1C9U3_9BACT|nr:16S rRNA pseudouridine(516) synthase [Opitutus sp. WL0086]WRQ88420.1 16S rRNA pseudouridine(516) synthase [Opitutus sp. WL0086]
MKLDRLLAKHRLMGRTQARTLLLARRVRVDGEIETRFDTEVDRFSAVLVDDEIVQPAARRLYLMLHKPVGVVSATSDAEHRTVLDLIDDPDKDTLHLVGRLDRNTSGLVLLTNDGRWSKALMHPDKKVAKVYRVTTRDPIAPDAVAAFAEGFYFHTEDLTTQPAHLEILTAHTARLTLHEGRYHQVKRMFHRIQNRVTALHRESIGDYVLPEDLPPGEWRMVPESANETARSSPCS